MIISLNTDKHLVNVQKSLKSLASRGAYFYRFIICISTLNISPLHTRRTILLCKICQQVFTLFILLVSYGGCLTCVNRIIPFASGLIQNKKPVNRFINKLAIFDIFVLITYDQVDYNRTSIQDAHVGKDLQIRNACGYSLFQLKNTHIYIPFNSSLFMYSI